MAPPLLPGVIIGAIVGQALRALRRPRRAPSRASRGRLCRTCVQRVRCFEPPPGADIREFDRQLAGQQDAINSMSPSELRRNLEAFSGRRAGDAAARVRLRGEETGRLRRRIQQGLETAGASERDAARIAGDEAARIMRELDVIHDLDAVAGGTGTLGGMGGRSENRSIGSQWRGARRDSLVEMAREAQRDGADSMDVRLERCGRRTS